MKQFECPASASLGGPGRTYREYPDGMLPSTGEGIMTTMQLKAKSMLAKTERRRSKRNHLVTPVELAWHTENGAYAREHVETEEVSTDGALLRMDHELPIRNVVELTCIDSGSWTLARVMRVGARSVEGWTPVAVEFAVPCGTFWSP